MLWSYFHGETEAGLLRAGSTSLPCSPLSLCPLLRLCSAQTPGSTPHMGWAAGLRTREEGEKAAALKPGLWHGVHSAAGWRGWCGWVCVFCLVLFLLAMCHFGGGETFNNAPSRSSRSVWRSEEPPVPTARGHSEGRGRCPAHSTAVAPRCAPRLLCTAPRTFLSRPAGRLLSVKVNYLGSSKENMSGQSGSAVRRGERAAVVERRGAG